MHIICQLWVKRLLIILGLVVSARAQPQNAALLYYRAFWITENSNILALASSKTELTPDQRRQFMNDTEYIGFLMRKAGTLPDCDWGFSETNASPFGVLGVISRANGLSKIAVQRFVFSGELRRPQDSPVIDLLASFDLSRHLSESLAILISLNAEAGIVQHALLQTAANIGGLSAAERNTVANSIRDSPQFFPWNLPAAISNQISLARNELQSAEGAANHSKDHLIQVLSEHNLVLPDAASTDTEGAILAKAQVTLQRMGQIADLYALTDVPYSTLKSRLSSRMKAIDFPIPIATWIEVFDSSWKKGRRTLILRDLFLTGLTAIDPNGVVSEDRLSQLPEGLTVKREGDGFSISSNTTTELAASIRFGRLRR
jgi:hypothetical protein